jgi:dihydroorotate dehydrogenase electron transfer subunit
MAIQTDGIILKNVKIKSIYFLLEIDCPSIANEAKPGQFVMIRISDDPYPLLRRPFSIYKSYSANHSKKGKRGHLFILYKKVGKGTQKMSALKKGQAVNLIGPLGNGFTLPPLPYKHSIILIGGGAGMASLSALHEVLGSGDLYVFIGGKTKDDILCEDDFPNGKVFIATEDGSRGEKGTVVDLFRSHLERFDKAQPHHVYICGPEGMLKSLKKVITSKKWEVEVSLEARMGCGFGACWGCVVRTKDVEMSYHRVCKEGPVFPLSEIVWE